MLLAVRIWPWVLAALVLLPVLAPGYVLSYDMVFVPDLAMRSDFLGLGSSLPRAVPSDAVVAVLDEVVPGMVLQKIVLVAALVLAGTGARRLVPSDNGVAQLAATSLYVWNPYVAERLGIGHWPLLLAYAALPWVVDAARRLRAGERALPLLVLWLALSALSAAGGVMAALAAITFLVGRGRAGLRRTVVAGSCALAVNAPWLVAGLLHRADAVTDPAAVEVFAAHREGDLPAPLAVLGLGGIWNADVVPVTRLGWAAVAALVLTLALCVLGWRAWTAWLPGRDVVGFLVLAAVGFTVAVAGAVAPTPMEWLVSTVPGSGLFRDGARFVALAAPLEASLFGMGAGVLAGLMRERVASVALAVGAVLVPLALMPDLAWGLAGGLRPVAYPDDYAAARAALVDRSDRAGNGDLLVLPFTSYRAPSWNHRRPTLDPVGRYMPLDYVASDVLYVSGQPIRGEDARARHVGRLVAGSLPPEQLTRRLAGEGIGWVVLDEDARRAAGDAAISPVMGDARTLFEGEHLKVWELPAAAGPKPFGTGATLTLGAAWVLAVGAVGYAAVSRVRARRSRGRRL
jgi:hypothetical protein